MYTASYTGSDDEGSGSTADRPRASVVYDALKHRLLLGEFRLGRRLAEVAVAEQLGVSRTPVREALTRLHAEGLVLRLPEGGFSPSAPDLHTIGELYEVRRGLELTAIHIDRPHDRTALEDLRTDWEEMEPAPDGDPEFVLQDEDFHVRLAGAAGNRSLVDMLTRVAERIRVVRIYDFLTADRIEQTIEEHLSIVGALLDDDRQLTERRLNRHLRVSREIAERRSALALSRMVNGGDDA